MSELSTRERVKAVQEALERRDAITAAFREFSSLSDEELTAKREEIFAAMQRDGDEMSIESYRGRQVEAIDQLMRQRGLKK